MPAPRIALIHAMPMAIEPVTQVFQELWPSARITHLLDESLPADLTAAGGITPAIVDRFVALARYCEGCGADAILDEALAEGNDVALLVTFEPSIPSLRKELEELASSRGMRLQLKTRTVPAAIAALTQGRAAEHDQLIATAAVEIGRCDALMLGQFSMARAAAGIPPVSGRRVLTSPHSAVARLKQLFADR